MITDLFKTKMLEYAKAHQADRLEVVRFFLAQVKNKEIELRPQNKEMTDETVYKVLTKLLKQTDETIEMCEKSGREEPLAKAMNEKAILQEFMSFFPADFLEAQIQLERQRQQKAQDYQNKKA